MKLNHLNKTYVICLIVLWIVFAKQSKAQNYIQPGDTNFSQIAARYVSLTPDSTFDSEYRKWKRFEDFWLKRLPLNGSFKNYYAAYKQLYNSINTTGIITSAASTLPFGNWTSLGPNSNSNYALNLGRTDRVQVDRDDASGNTIYVCSWTGGIFKTTDGGANWANFNSDFAFGTTIITDIRLVKDPNPPYDKYLYAAVGENPFVGIFRLKIGTTNWVNLTGNLTCAGMLDQTTISSVYKMLIDPTDLNTVYLATNKGVYYTCTSNCGSTCSGYTGLTWKKANLNVPLIGLEFDYSDATYKSLYCSGNQIWHTSDVLTIPFASITNLNTSTTYAFDNMSNYPTGIIYNASSFNDTYINITTHPNYPTRLFANVSVTCATNDAYILEYDKTNTTTFPNNFILRVPYYNQNLHPDKNFLHFSLANPNVLGCIYNFYGSFEAFDISALNSFNVYPSYGTFGPSHADSHDFDFSTTGHFIGSNDGGVYKAQVLPNVAFVNDINGTDGLAISRINSGSVWEKTGENVIAGLIDNHTEYSSTLNSNSSWAYALGTGDGGTSVYLPNGNIVAASMYLGTYPLKLYNPIANTLIDINPNPCLYVGWEGGASFRNLSLKTISNDLYLGSLELLYRNPDYATSNCSGTDGVGWHTLSNFRQMRINAGDGGNICSNNWINAFDVSADHSTMFASVYNNNSTASPLCGSGSFISLYKTTTGGINNPNVASPCTNPVGCWTPVATLAQLNLTGNISSIAIHPANSQVVWVSSAANYNPTNPGGASIITRSTDGGITWNNFTANLPNVGVIKLVVRPGTDYEIYAATDIGVYYTTAATFGTIGWERVGGNSGNSGNLPYVPVFDIQIDNCNNKLYAYSYGRGMWSIDLPTTNDPGPMPSVTLTQPLTNYTGTKYILNDIIIPSGKQLTINAANIYMGANTSIIVQPGARLDINNSTIQGYCDKNMWKQILVNGVGTAPQVINSGTGFYPNHGVVNINNSTIKDAGAAAVSLYNGGVVNAQNSNFINNRKGLEFYIYNFPNNQCKAQNCLFETNDNLKDPNNSIDAHVTAWAVDGVKFYGCTFRNTAPPGSNFNNLGNGIYSIDAFYTVDNNCGGCGTPPSTTGRSLFSNLNYGVYAQTTLGLKTLNLRNTDFQDCYGGTYIKGIELAKVQWCNYTNIPDNLNSSGVNPYGLYFDDCQNYFCENNNFAGILPGANNNLGLIINGANTNATRAYYCDFNNLAVGSAAYFDNYNNTQFKGLRFNCNKYTANQYDAAIIGGYINGSNTDIDFVQGNWTSGSTNFNNTVRNLYSANCIAGDNQWYDDGLTFGRIHVNLATQSGNGGSYFTRPQPGCYMPAKLNISTLIGNFTRNNSSCPIVGSGGGCTNCNPGGLSQSISANKQNLIAAEQPLLAGESATLLSAVNSNMSPGQLKNLLAQNSPYLSDVILASYFSKSNVPPGHAKDIHGLNAPVTDTVWQIIANKGYPNGIFNQMQSAQNTTALSGRTSQQGLLTSINAEIDYLYNEKLRLFMVDSVYRNNDSLKANILASNYSDKDLKLIDFYINTKQYTLANQQLNAIINNPQYSQYAEFKRDVIDALQKPEGVYSLTDTRDIKILLAKERILNLANTDFGLGQKKAQALANFVFGNKYDEFTALPNGGKGERLLRQNTANINDSKVDIDNLSSLKLIPNPSYDNTSIYYKLPNNELTGKIIISDITGKTVQYYDVIASLNQIHYNTNNLKAGIYFVNLVCNNSIVNSQKLVVIK